MKTVLQAAEQFIGTGDKIAGIERFGHGIINDTYLVVLEHQAKQFIVQRINTDVFKDPAAIMHNLRLVSEHVRNRIRISGSWLETEWQMLQVIPTRDGRDFFVDAKENFWRAIHFIRDAYPLERISSLAEAEEVGRAVGIFHRLTRDLKPELLRETLPGFHNIEQYLQHYDAVRGRMGSSRYADEFCRNFITARRSWAPVLEKARKGKALRAQVVHGDPKINNIMINSRSGKAVSIIDLDTMMPGLVHYDIGDCLRSCCNIMGEEAFDPGAVRFDLGRCKAVLTGYTTVARSFLTSRDFDFLFDAVRLIPFELGLRFYTDFLEGNRYFEVSRDSQNLDRARVQFKLVESIEQQEEAVRLLIEECRGI